MANQKQKLQERRHKREVRKRFLVAAIISSILAAISLIVGAYFTGYEYATAIASQSQGASAPPEVALFTALPYIAASLILLIFAAFAFYKSKKREKSCVTENN